MPGLDILNEGQLRELAGHVWDHEQSAIRDADFPSDNERQKCHNKAKLCYDSVLGLLNDGANMEQKFQDTPGYENVAYIASAVFDYMKVCVNMALQTVPNHSVRLHYVGKIREHSQHLLERLDKVDPNDDDELEILGETTISHKNALLGYSNVYDSNVSESFSKMIHENNMSLEDLVKKYQNDLGEDFAGSFEELKLTQKIQVYEAIIFEATGQGRISVKLFEGHASKSIGYAPGIVAGLVFWTAALLAWRLYAASSSVSSVVKKAANIFVSFVAAAIGTAAAATVGVACLALGAEFPILIPLAPYIAFFVGNGISFIFADYGGELIDKWMSSGSTDSKDKPLSSLNGNGYECYLLKLYDGVAMGRRIAYPDHDKTN